MKFPKDILLIDFEGFNSPKQIGAVLLDKETLEEKDSFSSYIYADVGERVGAQSGITQEMLSDAPTQEEVGKMFYDRFSSDVILASFTSDLDIRHLRAILTAAGIDPTLYDYHILDVWPLSCVHLLKQGYKGSLRSEEIFQAFGTKPRERHDALEDCRIAAEVLRKVCL